jgi:GT2 family glycosyltransferase
MNALTPDLTIIIPVRNDAVRLRRCLDAIRANTTSARVGVIVADNGSTDDSRTVGAAAGATVLSLPGYRVGELRNLAVRATSSPLIGFVDADHIVDSGWIRVALEVFQDTAVTAAGAPYSAGPSANWVQRAYARSRPTVTSAQPTDWLGSGNLLVRREAFEQVHGFDAGLESCEDVDLCNRLRLAGHRLVADPRLRSVHLGDPASLRALFFGELWRGRDNIKVTLRGPLTLRALPSVVIPVVTLALLLVIAVAGWMSLVLAISAALIVATLTGLRAARMSIGKGRLMAQDVAANIAVAAVYDLARALSLVARATHRTRRERAGERAIA